MLFRSGDGFIRSWDEPVRLFEHLFRRFLCEVDRNEKVSNLVSYILKNIVLNNSPMLHYIQR